jgi:hypothetical protein
LIYIIIEVKYINYSINKKNQLLRIYNETGRSIYLQTNNHFNLWKCKVHEFIQIATTYSQYLTC